MLLIKMFLFALLMAYICAKFEIEIEGKQGWAQGLPTWKFTDRLTRFFWGDQVVTGYHLWYIALVLTFIHFPFVVGIIWIPSLELLLLAMFCTGILIEDFLWFLMNPAFGLKKLTKAGAPWHNSWLGPVPGMYWKLVIVITSFLFIANLFQNIGV